MKLYITLFLVVLSAHWSSSQSQNLISVSSNQQLIDSIIKVEPKYNTFQITKMSMPLEMNGRDMTANVGIKIKRDSAIHISIQFMGSEMMKLEFTLDSLRIFNKMDSKFYEEDYAYFSERMGVNLDYNSIQSILSNQFFCFGKKDATADDMRFSVSDKGVQQVVYTEQTMTQLTQINPLFRISQFRLSDSANGYQLITDYADFKPEGTMDFPRTMNVQLIKPKSRTLYTFSIQKVSFNKPLVFTPNSPERYRYGELEELIK